MHYLALCYLMGREVDNARQINQINRECWSAFFGHKMMNDRPDTVVVKAVSTTIAESNSVHFYVCKYRYMDRFMSAYAILRAAEFPRDSLIVFYLFI